MRQKETKEEILAQYPHCREGDYNQAAEYANGDLAQLHELMKKYERDYVYTDRCEHAEAAWFEEASYGIDD